LKQASFFEAAGAVAKIDFRESRTSIAKFSLPKLVKHTVMGIKNANLIFSNFCVKIPIFKFKIGFNFK
jgi:hypothetical protein